MNTGNNNIKQKEKILIGSIAATALGLVNAKPQIAKAAYNGNSNLATKKANRKTIKTKINYKTAHNPRAEKTEFLQAADESASETSYMESQNSDNTDNNLTNQNVNSTPNNNDHSLASSNQINNTENTEDKSKSTVKQDMNSSRLRPKEARKVLTGKWYNQIPFTYESGGTLNLGDGKDYTIITIGHGQGGLNGVMLDDGSYLNKSPNQPIKTININSKITLMGSASGIFADLTGLITINNIDNLIFTQGTTSTDGLFQRCGSLETINGLDSLDFSHVTDASNMFSGCSSLSSIPGFDKLNFSKVTNISYMFFGCAKLKSLVFPNTFKSAIKDSSYMLSGCTGLEDLDISNLDMSKISNFMGMLGDSPYPNSNLTSLKTLVLGPTNVLSKGEKNNVGLVVPGTWINMGVDYSDTHPLQKGTYSWNSADLMKNYQGDRHDTYRRFTGKPITIHYLDESDKTTKIIADKVINDGDIGDPFNVINYGDKNTNYTELPDDLNKKYTFDQYNSTNLTGQFSDKQQEVNLYYKKKVAGTVTIHYLDESDKTTKIIADKVINDGNIDDPFNVINYGDKNTNYTVLPGELNKKYTFDKEDSKNVSGTFTNTPQDVYLYYTRNKGKTITIHYQDEKSGKTIAPDRQYASGYYGDPFDASAPEYSDLTGYTLDKAKSKNVSGTFTNTPQDVYLYYTRNKGAQITIHYHDESGKTIAPDRQYASGYYGDPFDATAPEYSNLAGYTLDKTKSKNVSGTFSDKPQEVTLVYTKNPDNTANKVKAGVVTVHYQDEYGKTLAPDKILNGYVGDGYTTGAEQVSGYTLKTRPENATGFFNTFPQSVIYIYSKKENNAGTNTITPDDNKPTAIPAGKKSKRKTIKNLSKNKYNNQPMTNRKSIPTNKTNNNIKTLPKTGINKYANIAICALGGLALIGALGATWLNRRKSE